MNSTKPATTTGPTTCSWCHRRWALQPTADHHGWYCRACGETTPC